MATPDFPDIFTGQKSADKTFLLYGPPGTGKTSSLARKVARDAEKYGGHSVMVSSFTRAAAKEIASRIDAIPDKNVGTLHSFCRRALNSDDKIAETHVKDFCASFPERSLGSNKFDPNDPYREGQKTSRDDAAFQEINILRAKMIPEDQWPEYARDLYRDWKTWKSSNQLIDFTDMLEICLRDHVPPPFPVSVGIFDEMQDSSALQMALISQWGRDMQQLCLALDDDQCLDGSTMLEAEDGTQKKLQWIVEYKLSPKVMCYNHETNEIEFRKVIGWHKRKLGKRRALEVGPVKVTQEHPIFTEDGYVEAGEINERFVKVLILSYWSPGGVTWRRYHAERYYFKNIYRRTFYCVDVEGNHNFFANGVLVHNCIFQWAGADSAAVMDLNVPEEHCYTLEQSYRVPRAVHEHAVQWIRQVDKRRDKKYRPRDAEGEVVYGCGATYKIPEPLLGRLCDYAAEGKTCMVVAPCAYMIDPIIARMRKDGIPFHNPYRSEDGKWNPLAHGNERRTMAIDRFFAFLKPYASLWGDEARPWTWHDLSLWASCLEAKGIFIQGGKKWIEELKGDRTPFEPQALMENLTPEGALAFDGLRFGSDEDAGRAIRWWLDHCLDDRRKVLEYPARVAEKYGVARLVEEPKIIVGTGHSLKGSEADVVAIFPDMSYKGIIEWNTPTGRDAIRRLFYVMMTRARETLILCSPASRMSVSIT